MASWFNYVPYAFRALQYRAEIEAFIEEAEPAFKKAIAMIPEFQRLFDKAKDLLAKIAPDLFPALSKSPDHPVTVSPSTSSEYDVRWLQTALNAKMPNVTPLRVDGIYGPNTKSRVEAYQQLHNLKIDGWAGIETMGSLLG
jgi:peptidoglycan hydrolase-like protein with peptidoglycan-binding domain